MRRCSKCHGWTGVPPELSSLLPACRCTPTTKVWMFDRALGGLRLLSDEDVAALRAEQAAEGNN